jgi:CAAX protease family protein
VPSEVNTSPRWWQKYVLDVVAEAESASSAHRETATARSSLRRVTLVLIGASLSLTFIHFVRTPPATLVSGANAEFSRLAWWAGVSIVGYVVIPLAVIRSLGATIRDFGGGRPRPKGSGRPYAFLFALSVPFLVAASYLPSFREGYPFYEPDPGQPWWPLVATFWLLYILQFVAVEFFFRGFMLFGLAPRLGIASVLVMVVPYTMIHFDKPAIEALSAILGGTVLGFLSLKANSFWWSAAIHIGIAMTMELLTLWHIGFF